MSTPASCRASATGGFALGQAGAVASAPVLSAHVPELRILDAAVLAEAALFSRDRRPQELPPSTLDPPRIVPDMREGYAV